MIIAYVDDNEDQRIRTLPVFMQGFKNYNIPVRRFDFFSSGESFWESWKQESYDLVILDIFMDEISGLDIARRIREENTEARIVFCSTSNEFANESYDVNACYYIQKPVTSKMVSQMIARLNMEDFELRRFIILPDGQKLVLRNMIYAEYSNHQVIIHNKKGEDQRLWISHSAFASLLLPYGFFVSCNSGSVINLWEVSSLKDDVFIMNGSACVPISRRKKNEAKNAYQAFLINSVRKEL